MTTILFREWELAVDRELTKSTYDLLALGAAESCGCDCCKNFVSSRELLYPAEVRLLFESLGIDYTKDSEVWHCCKLNDGLHLYSGWFHFKGRFTGKDCAVASGDKVFSLELTPVSERFSIGFHYDNGLAFFEDGANLVQVEFEAKTPWTLAKELEPA